MQSRKLFRGKIKQFIDFILLLQQFYVTIEFVKYNKCYSTVQMLVTILRSYKTVSWFGETAGMCHAIVITY